MGWNWINEPIQWLPDPSWTMFWSVLIYTWATLGFYMLILLYLKKTYLLLLIVFYIHFLVK